MKKLLFTLIFLSSCASGSLMTLRDYEDITPGQETKTLEGRFGSPYEIRELSGDKKEYVYIERVPLSSRTTLFRIYVFTISGDKVIGKKMSESRTPPLEFQL
jgi:hypothetical protein